MRQLGGHGNGDGQVALLRARLSSFEAAGVEGEKPSRWASAARAWPRVSRKDGTIQSRASRVKTVPICEASCPLMGAKVPMRPCRWSFSMRLVETAPEHHAAIETLEVVRRDLGLELGIEQPVAVQDGQALGGKLRLDRRSGHGGSGFALLSYPKVTKAYQRDGPLGERNGQGGRPHGLPPLAVSHGTSFLVPVRRLLRVSTNSTWPVHEIEERDVGGRSHLERSETRAPD
jgi:hypothetical protein